MVYGKQYIVDGIQTSCFYKPWLPESPLSWALEPECRILMSAL